MGEFDRDTALVALGEGRYQAELRDEWAIWGPNGGYLAVIALRAAGCATALRRPASFTAHFLGVADFATVDLTVRVLRETRRAASLAVSMSQRGAPILEAVVWVVADGLAGLEHEAMPAPEVPRPEDVLAAEDRLPDDVPTFPFWRNLEARPCEWIDDWERRPFGQTRERTWYRFRPTATYADPFLDAGRSLLVLDTVMFPAAMRGHPGEEGAWYAPSLDVNARFHTFAPASEWLLADAHSPVAADGLVGGTAAIWSSAGDLLATGGQQMLSRPRRLSPGDG